MYDYTFVHFNKNDFLISPKKNPDCAPDLSNEYGIIIL